MVRDQESDAPVPLSEEEVTALVRGQMPDDRIASILEAKTPRLKAVLPAEEPAGAAPVDISAAELDALAAGRDVDSVTARIEKAAKGEQAGAD